MRCEILVSLLVTSWMPAALAQQAPAAAVSVPRMDISAGYNYVGANSPPGGSDHFGLQGGYVSGSFNLWRWVSVAGEFTGEHASNISTLGQDLTLMTFTGGPRVMHTYGRFTPFGEALFGGAHAGNSYFPQGTTGSTTSATSFALSAGGGVDLNLSNQFSIRLARVDYLRTSFPNGSSNEQNQLMAGAGVVFHFGSRGHAEQITYAAPTTQISFNCTSNVAGVVQGQTLNVTGSALTEPSGAVVNYAWSTSGGTAEGTGREVNIDTNGLAPGDYQVTGHAMLMAHPSKDATCNLTFHVLARENEVPVVEQPSPTKEDEVFHANVPDVLFDYDSYAIRPDAQTAIDKAAQYLKDHPAIDVLIAGYADERGSIEYNLALAGKRADAARNALIQDAISGDRLKIISYGKEAQVCTEQTEACFQQNRRAALNLGH
jgi:outer membrane protein OmpA-like peptidoglycan-associated protein